MTVLKGLSEVFFGSGDGPVFDPAEELARVRLEDELADERARRKRSQDALTECAASFKEELDSLRERVGTSERARDAYQRGFRDGMREMAEALEMDRAWREAGKRSRPKRGDLF